VEVKYVHAYIEQHDELPRLIGLMQLLASRKAGYVQEDGTLAESSHVQALP